MRERPAIALPAEKVLIFSGRWSRESWVWDLVAGLPEGSVIVNFGGSNFAVGMAKAACKVIHVPTISIRSDDEERSWQIFLTLPGKPIVACYGTIPWRFEWIARQATKAGYVVHRFSEAAVPVGSCRAGSRIEPHDRAFVALFAGDFRSGDRITVDGEAMEITAVEPTAIKDEWVVRVNRTGAHTKPHRVGVQVRRVT